MLPFTVYLDDDEKNFLSYIYNDYRRLMYKTAYEIAGNHWQAEDSVQTTIERLIPKVNLLKQLPKAKQINYIITTVKNTTLTSIKNDSRIRTVPLEDSEDTPDSISRETIEEYLELIDETKIIREIWEDLPARTRHILKCRYFLGMNSSEISLQLNESSTTIRMALYRARKSILEKYLHKKNTKI